MARKRPTNSAPKRAVTRGRDWTKTFLKALGDSGNVTIACDAAAIDRATAYNKRRDDEAFAKQWRASLNEAADMLEAEARRRAYHGLDEPVIHQGQMMGQWVMPDGKVVAKETAGAILIPFTIKKYSDVLLMFLLKGARPKRFRDTARVEHTGKDGKPLPKPTTTTTIIVTDLDRCATEFEQFARRGMGEALLPPHRN
jgi:hypothetical protein